MVKNRVKGGVYGKLMLLFFFLEIFLFYFDYVKYKIVNLFLFVVKKKFNCFVVLLFLCVYE